MARCSHPHYTLDLGLKENGKRNLKFVGFRPDLSSLKQLQARYGEKIVVPLPCGKCVQCMINHAKEWAVRCVLEALDHEENYFITLTYDNEHLPADGALHKDHLQKFFKRLRQEFGSFRYFACGELGKAGKRPHFHALVFGLHLPDIKPVLGHAKSDRFSKVWSFGAYSIDEVTYASANYVAQYQANKLFKGVNTGEFILASNRPGLGAHWCEQHLDNVLKYDAVFGSFGDVKSARMPRYFEKVAERIDLGRFETLKRSRLNKNNAFQLNAMLVHQFTEVEHLLIYEEQCTLNEFISRRRGVREL